MFTGASPDLYILIFQAYTYGITGWHSSCCTPTFGDFNSGVCHVVIITAVESKRDIGPLPHQAFGFDLFVLARDQSRLMMTMSV